MQNCSGVLSWLRGSLFGRGRFHSSFVLRIYRQFSLPYRQFLNKMTAVSFLSTRAEHVKKSTTLIVIPAMLALVILLAACETRMPSIDAIRDSKLLDRRITETPRQRVMRECQQEAT